tara:strand:- start:178 stop:741 length:564 start_codon:yes stop_codon:yes gene_type:complete
MRSIIEVTVLICCALHLETSDAAAMGARCPSLLFATELEAVIAAADSYNPRSIREDREYVGAIFEEDGKFGYTVAANPRRKDSWRLSVARVEWDRIRAFWHTHGDASPQHRYFSNSDTESVERLGVPFYLADYTGYLKIFRSGDRLLSPFAASRLNLPRQSGFAVGEYARDAVRRPVRVKVRERFRS